MYVSRLRIFLFLIPLQFVTSAKGFAEELSFDVMERSPRGVTGLTFAGPSGGLTIPDGRVLPDGVAVFGFNNLLEPRFASANSGRNYLFGLGLFPHIELTGRYANYPNNQPVYDFSIRDLSANLKVSIPKLFDFQPDIAFGMNDLGGGAQNFRSKYIVVSERFGPVKATVGRASGVAGNMHGLFGGAEWALGESGFSLLAERNSGVNSAGVRYGSAPIAGFANARIVATAQRSFGAETSRGANFDRTTLGIALVIPFGENARTVSIPPSASQPVPGPAIPSAVTVPAQSYAPVSATSAAPVASAAPGAVAAPQPVQLSRTTTESNAMSSATAAAAPAVSATVGPQSLQAVQTALEKAGLERVRVGLAGVKLVIEYENHRYNRNEVDAIGIALGIGARLAPEPVKRIAVVTKKTGLALYETSVDRGGFRRFLADADPYEVSVGLLSELRPVDDGSIEWLDRAEGKRGFSRVVIQPVINSFIGTEVGAFDYSLGASVQGIVPLWKGANVLTDYVTHVTDSDNVSNGPFAYARVRSGVRTAVVSQAFWVTDRILNVFTVGKYQYDYTGFQNEATLFVPGRNDQIRFQYSRLQYSDQFSRDTRVSAGAFYRWNYQPLDLTIEAGYHQFVANDRGLTVRASRWFGDMEAQAYIRRSSEQITFAGVQLVFPLTPRQGMRPGLTHFQGPGQFAYGVETKLASRGGDNRITRNVAEEIPLVYGSRNFLLNRGRMGEDYLASQLPRMREAALLFSTLD